MVVLVEELEPLRAKYMLPAFDERVASQTLKQIDLLTDQITKAFRACQSSLTTIGTESRKASRIQDRLLGKNLQAGLALRLQSLSSTFRTHQNNYMQQINDREKRAQSLLVEHAVSKRRTEQEEEEGGMSTAVKLDTEMDQQIRRRQKDITHMTQSINEIADIFKDLQTMIVDQGTVLDRIDYNVEMATLQIKKGHVELGKANAYQRKATSRRVYFLGALAVFLVVLVIYMVFTSNTGKNKTESN
jgi:syntaxin 16